MPKKSKISLKTPTNEINYDVVITEKDNIYNYREDTENKTEVFFNKDKNLLIREDDNLLMKYRFVEGKETKGFLKIKELNKILKVVIKTKKIVKELNKIEIEYELENDLYKYIIEVK